MSSIYLINYNTAIFTILEIILSIVSLNVSVQRFRYLRKIMLELMFIIVNSNDEYRYIFIGSSNIDLHLLEVCQLTHLMTATVDRRVKTIIEPRL